MIKLSIKTQKIVACIFALMLLTGLFSSICYTDSIASDNELYEAVIGQTYYPTLREAIKSAHDGDLITVLKDNSKLTGREDNSTYDDVDTFGASNLTIDLNNKTVTNNKGMWIVATNLTIKNGTMTGENLGQSYSIFVGDEEVSSVTLENIKAIGGFNFYNTVATINNCEVTLNKGYNVLYADEDSTVTVNDGRYDSTNRDHGTGCLGATGNSKFIINDGVFIGKDTFMSSTEATSTSAIEINGGIFSNDIPTECFKSEIDYIYKNGQSDPNNRYIICKPLKINSASKNINLIASDDSNSYALYPKNALVTYDREVSLKDKLAYNWESTNPSVCTVTVDNNNGNVKLVGKAKGTCKINFKKYDIVVDSCDVKVFNRSEATPSFQFSKNDITLSATDTSLVNTAISFSTTITFSTDLDNEAKSKLQVKVQKYDTINSKYIDAVDGTKKVLADASYNKTTSKVTVKGISAGKGRVVAMIDNQELGSVPIRILFRDVKTDPNSATYQSVYWANDNGIVNGYSDSTIFKPTDNATRQQFALILWRHAGKPVPLNSEIFGDCKHLSTTSDSYSAILWCSQNGISNGYNNGTEFRPMNKVTRLEMAIMLYRYAGLRGIDRTIADNAKVFEDTKSFKPATDKYSAIMWTSSKGIANGYTNGNFGINDNSQRQQLCIMLYKLNNLLN